MTAAPLPDDEPARLARLRALAVLDSAPEPLFDALTRMAAQVCGTPISLISLVDADRQWFKSSVGLDVSETPRDLAFCAHTLLGTGLMEVPDATADPRFAANPLVTGAPHIRFYAAVPLALAEGERVGTLCVIDRRPRVLDAFQRRLLTELAGAAAQALEMREGRVAQAATERALRDSERKFRVLCDSAPIGVFHTDAAGQCTYTNGRWQQIFALTLEQSLRDGWSRPLHPDDRDAVWTEWASATRAARDFEMQFRILRPDGSLRHVSSLGRPLIDAAGGLAGFVGAVEDITAALEQRRELRVLYEASPAMLHSIDRHGVLLTVTDRWLSTLGYRRDEVIGRKACDFFAPPSRLQISGELMPALRAQGRFDDVALQMTCRDGSLRDVRVSALLERDDAGEPRRALIFMDDETDDLARRAQLQQEHALRRQVEEHAVELKRLLAERGEMIDVLAHEVRQPLNNASAALQSAAAALVGTGTAAAGARLERARTVLGQVLAGIDNTLAAASLLSGTGQLERQDTDIDMLIGVVIADLPPLDRARVAVDRATPTRTASMDLGLVRLALRNLLANALRYSPQGSPVGLRIADSDEPLALVLEVSDSGSGFDADMVQRVFERGARGRHGGTGLGLYIARRVMDLHGGRIELMRDGPRGSTLRLVIEQSRP